MEDEKIIKKFVNGIFIVGVFRHEDSKESFPNILRNIRKTWNHGKDSGYEYSDGGMYYPLFHPLFFSESEETGKIIFAQPAGPRLMPMKTSGSGLSTVRAIKHLTRSNARSAFPG